MGQRHHQRQGRKSHSPHGYEKLTELKLVEYVSKRDSKLFRPLVWLLFFQNVLTTHLHKKHDVLRSPEKPSLKNHCAPFKAHRVSPETAEMTPNYTNTCKGSRWPRETPESRTAGRYSVLICSSVCRVQQLRDGSWALQWAGNPRPGSSSSSAEHVAPPAP